MSHDCLTAVLKTDMSNILGEKKIFIFVLEMVKRKHTEI